MAKRHRKNQNRGRVRQPQFRVNEFIRIPEIRLVGDNLDVVGERIGKTIEPGIYSSRQAKEWARAMDLDLVEISPNAKPPVCKIIDYKKFLYQKKKKEKEIKAKAVKTIVKEIRFGPNMGDHDFEFKLRHAKAFLEEGTKVKIYVQFRGRSIVFKDRGELLILRFVKELTDFGTPESLPKMEGRRMIVVVSPKKSGKKKS